MVVYWILTTGRTRKCRDRGGDCFRGKSNGGMVKYAITIFI
jgi:hypothetical protein